MNPEITEERYKELYQQRLLEYIATGMNTRQAKRQIAKDQKKALKDAQRRAKAQGNTQADDMIEL